MINIVQGEMGGGGHSGLLRVNLCKQVKLKYFFIGSNAIFEPSIILLNPISIKNPINEYDSMVN
jgi:hypothetical protein